LGAENFVFYNHSAHGSLKPYLNSLAERGLATIVDWSGIPVFVRSYYKGRNSGSLPGDPELQAFGQLSALNDCLYRNIHRSQFVINQDVDELIVHARTASWKALIKKLPTAAAAHIARMAYFPLEQQNAGPFAEDQVAQKLPPLVKLKRDSLLLPTDERSKYIANTDKVKLIECMVLWVVPG
jgi:hypothetical protein